MAHDFRIPRPRSVLGLISLRTATEFIHFILIINKLTGLYGILAIFTGYHLSSLQLSHYIYSLVVLGLASWLAQSLREPGKPLHNLALAWLYIVDSLIGSVYTGIFGASWFLLLSQHLNENSPIANAKLPGTEMMNDTAGFTSPEHPATHVDVIAAPAPGLLDGQEAVAFASKTGTLGGAIFQSGSLASFVVLCVLWTLRAYFCVIVMSYARGMLRRYIVAQSAAAGYAQSEDPSLAENPFRQGSEGGAGWKGKLGRAMLRFPTKRYWLGRDEAEEAWVKAASLKFQNSRASATNIKSLEKGVGERERRARSGTGPPVPLATPKALL